MKQFTVEEKHISATVKDFDAFCDYIEHRRPKLSQRMEALGKNDLFSLNAQLFHRKEVSLPNFQQESYPVIDLLFKLVLLGGLYRKEGNDKADIYLERTSLKLQFDEMNNYGKYCFLLEIFWTKFDFVELLYCGEDIFDQFTTIISESKPGQKLEKNTFSKRSMYEFLFSYNSVIVRYFNFLGFCSFEELKVSNKKQGKYEDSISGIFTTEFGINICKILRKLKLTLWSYPYLLIMGIYTDDEYYELSKVPFKQHFLPIFPQNALLKEVKPEVIQVKKGNYTFKIMLDKTTWRKIKLSHKHNLEDLHRCIQEAFDFDNDHLYSFFMNGKKNSDDAYHSSYCDDGPYADEAIIGKLDLYKGKKILYLFDYGDSWKFMVQLVAIDKNEKEIKEPLITETKGVAPPQYCFEEEFDDDSDE